MVGMGTSKRPTAAVLAARRGQRRAGRRRWRVGVFFAFGCVLAASAAFMFEPLGGDPVEAVYCAAMTLVGVGYGDGCPRSDRARVGGVAALLLGGGFVRGPVLDRCRELAYDDDGRWAPWQRFGGAVAVGAALFAWLEDWAPPEAAYFAAVSATTAGFGDVAPVTRSGRLAAVAYVLLTARLAALALEDAATWWFFRGAEKTAALFGLACAAAVFAVFDGQTLLDACYCGVATLTTVGFGDICPKTTRTSNATRVAVVAVRARRVRRRPPEGYYISRSPI